jgi:hypothetical protein
MCKVQWSHYTEDEATWEHEEELRADYPEHFSSTYQSRGDIPFKTDRSITPTFCIIKLCQARSALCCILERFTLRKIISQFKLA